MNTMLILTNTSKGLLYIFSVDTAAYQSKNQSSAYRWGSNDLVGARPALQFMGLGADSIKLKGDIYPHYKGGFLQLELLKFQAERGVPFLMVEGTGFVYGHYIIESISNENSIFTSMGKPKKISFDISLKKFKGLLDDIDLGI